MSKNIKEKIYQLLAKIKILPFIQALRILKVIEIDYGHFYSVFKLQSIDKYGNPIPWFTYPAIDFIKSLDLSEKRLFEFGSGNSTLFWSQNCKEVLSVEDNKYWFNKISKQIKREKIKNVKLIYAPRKSNYLSAIRKSSKKLDIIVIDGSYREECINKNTINKLKPKGFIILDNSDKYPQISKKLEVFGFKKIDFNGIGPINPYTWTTTFFYKIKN